MPSTIHETSIPIPGSLFRGDRRLRMALVGMPNSGKSTIFKAVSSTSVHTGELVGTRGRYGECNVQIGLDEASLLDLPSVTSLHQMQGVELEALKYLLWGNERPPVSAHEADSPAVPFSPPQVIIQVVDATALEHHLGLTLELSALGRPVVIALNRMDEAQKKGMHINIKHLSRILGMPVVPTVAVMGHGISEVFRAAVEAVRQASCPLPQPASEYICESLQPLGKAINRPDVKSAFRVPQGFLLMQLAGGERQFLEEFREHFPAMLPDILRLRDEAEAVLPRPLDEEIRADRHHRAAVIYESVTRLGGPVEGRRWRYWLDELFLHPQWGLLGSLVVFALVLFLVFEVSTWLDSLTSARLVDWVSSWQPHDTIGVIARAVVDGLIGLVGIVVPYMIPLVLLLVALEDAGVMQRIAFTVDRGFHKIGLHGAAAVPFLLGLGCNVPAISAMGRVSSGRDRIVASLLITFVPCSARSAVILAIAGKYLGGIGVFVIFMLSILVIAVMGRLLSRRYTETGPGLVQEIPPYAMPHWRSLLHNTWLRTSDILTIVTPLLVGGSVVLALLAHFGADSVINTLLIPITHWWLGLPVVLGVPILFGVLRKELSLLMIYQAFGTMAIGQYMDWVQIITFLLFLTFYVPCISTYAVMNKTLGRKEALFSVGLSVVVALLVSGAIRLVLELARLSGLLH
jgi:ferrous iron transport protein B